MHPPPAQRAGKGHYTSHPDTEPPNLPRSQTESNEEPLIFLLSDSSVM